MVSFWCVIFGVLAGIVLGAMVVLIIEHGGDDDDRF